MRTKARRVALPKDRVGAPGLLEVDRVDVVECRHDSDRRVDAREFALAFVGYRPLWFRALLALRAALVRPFGLRSQGRSKMAVPRRVEPGGRLAFFEVVEAWPHRVLLRTGDVHLASLLLIESAPGAVLVSSGIRCRNGLGRAYAALTAPFRLFVLRRFAEHAALQALAKEN